MLPEHTKDGLLRWVQYGIGGGFITAVVENNLMEAFGRADEENQINMLDICKWVYRNMPVSCYGSKEKADAWKGLSPETFEAWKKGCVL